MNKVTIVIFAAFAALLAMAEGTDGRAGSPLPAAEQDGGLGTACPTNAAEATKYMPKFGIHAYAAVKDTKTPEARRVLTFGGSGVSIDF